MRSGRIYEGQEQQQQEHVSTSRPVVAMQRKQYVSVCVCARADGRPHPVRVKPGFPSPCSLFLLVSSFSFLQILPANCIFSFPCSCFCKLLDDEARIRTASPVSRVRVVLIPGTTFFSFSRCPPLALSSLFSCDGLVMCGTRSSQQRPKFMHLFLSLCLFLFQRRA